MQGHGLFWDLGQLVAVTDPSSRVEGTSRVTLSPKSGPEPTRGGPWGLCTVGRSRPGASRQLGVSWLEALAKLSFSSGLVKGSTEVPRLEFIAAAAMEMGAAQTEALPCRTPVAVGTPKVTVTGSAA